MNRKSMFRFTWSFVAVCLVSFAIFTTTASAYAGCMPIIKHMADTMAPPNPAALQPNAYRAVTAAATLLLRFLPVKPAKSLPLYPLSPLRRQAV
jgi:hypothetical protein